MGSLEQTYSQVPLQTKSLHWSQNPGQNQNNGPYTQAFEHTCDLK